MVCSCKLILFNSFNIFLYNSCLCGGQHFCFLICFYQILNRNKNCFNCRRWGWPLSRLPFEQFQTSSPSSPLRRQAKSLECLWEFTLRSAVHFCVWHSLNLYQHSTDISCTDTTWYSYCLSAQQPLSVIIASASSSFILNIRIPHCGTIIKFFLWNVSENPPTHPTC